MSFILKALQKLEADKAARQAGPAEINRAILAPAARPFSSPRRGAKWLVIPLVFVAGVGMTWYFVGKTAPPAVQARQKDALSGPSPRYASASRMGPQADKPEPPETQTSPPENLSAGQPLPRQKARQGIPDGPLRNDSATAASLPAHQPPVDVAAPPLTVNGIALQDEPEESVAVVNGALVKIGMTVGGVKVDGIFQDKVRFKGNGGTFEVHLVK